MSVVPVFKGYPITSRWSGFIILTLKNMSLKEARMVSLKDQLYEGKKPGVKFTPKKEKTAPKKTEKKVGELSAKKKK